MDKSLSITQICTKLRELAGSDIFIANSKKLAINYDLAWVAMDMIEDTQLAIDAFSSIKLSSDKGNEYLRVYGLFQAMYMQQDAVRNLADSFGLPKPDVVKDSPQAHEVRELRNKYFGHSKHERKGVPTTYHGISRMTIGSTLIRTWTWPDMLIEEINITKSIKINEEYIADSLNEVWTNMQNKKAGFAKDIASTLPSDRHSYNFEKIHSWVHGFDPNTHAVAEVGLGLIEKSVQEIEDGLNERYVNLGSIGAVERSLNKCRYTITALRKLLDKNPSNMAGDFYAEVHIEALQKTYYELLDYCADVNKEFTANSSRSDASSR